MATIPQAGFFIPYQGFRNDPYNASSASPPPAQPYSNRAPNGEPVSYVQMAPALQALYAGNIAQNTELAQQMIGLIPKNTAYSKRFARDVAQFISSTNLRLGHIPSERDIQVEILTCEGQKRTYTGQEAQFIDALMQAHANFSKSGQDPQGAEAYYQLARKTINRFLGLNFEFRKIDLHPSRAYYQAEFQEVPPVGTRYLEPLQ